MLERGRMIGKFKTVSALLSAYESLEAEFTKRCQQLRGLRNELETLKRDTHLRAKEEEAACEKVFDVTNEQGKEKIEATELEEGAYDSAQKNDSVKEEGADIESVNCEGAKAEVSAESESVNCEGAKTESSINGEELKAEVGAESDIAVTAQRAAEQAEMQTARQTAEQAAMQAEQAEMQTAMQAAEQAKMQATEQAAMQTARQTAEQAAMQAAMQAAEQAAMQTEQGADEFLQRALTDERVRQAIIAEYFNEIAARKNIVMSQGAVPITPPTRPKTLKEAKALADKLLF